MRLTETPGVLHVHIADGGKGLEGVLVKMPAMALTRPLALVSMRERVLFLGTIAKAGS